MNERELKAANNYFKQHRPLCRFKMHKREEWFYGNIIAITEEKDGTSYSIEYDLPGAQPGDRKYYAVVLMHDAEIIKTRRPGFWGWLSQWFK